MKRNIKKLKNNMVFIFSLLGLIIPTVILVFLNIKILKNNSFLLVIIFLILQIAVGIIIQALIHELGHLIGGILSGYRFLFYRIGNLTLLNEDGNLTFRKFSIPGTLGQCVMAPPEFNRGRYPYLLYNLGGVLINIISGIILLFFFIKLDLSIFTIFLFSLGALGIYLGITNGIPIKGMPNDGSNIKEIQKGFDGKLAFYNMLESTELRLKDEEEWKIKSLMEKDKFSDYENRLVISLLAENVDYYILKEDFPKALEVAKWIKKQRVLSYIELQDLDINLFSIYLLLGDEKNINRYKNRKDINKILNGKSHKEGERLKFIYYSLYEKNNEKRKEALRKYKKLSKNHLLPYSVRIDEIFINKTLEKENWIEDFLKIDKPIKDIKIPNDKKGILSNIDENGNEGIFLKISIENNDIKDILLPPIASVLTVESIFFALSKKTKIKWISDIMYFDYEIGNINILEDENALYIGLRLSDEEKIGHLNLRKNFSFENKILFYLMPRLYNLENNMDKDELFLKYNKYLYIRNQFITVERRGEKLDFIFTGVDRNLDLIGEIDGKVKKYKFNDIKIV